MVRNFQKQPQFKVLPASDIEAGLGLRETDFNELTSAVRTLLPQYIDWNPDVTITLLEKNLKIIADPAIMKESMAHLIKNIMDRLPGGGNFSLKPATVNCKAEALLEGFNLIAGAGVFIYPANAATGIDHKAIERAYELFFTMKTDDGKNLGLPIAYRIIEQPGWNPRERNQWRWGETNIYLPLTRQEILSIMSIPVSVSYGR
jgi:nitrogen fixation/metabolism regulation signal transduction histidine kinase